MCLQQRKECKNCPHSPRFTYHYLVDTSRFCTIYQSRKNLYLNIACVSDFLKKTTFYLLVYLFEQMHCTNSIYICRNMLYFELANSRFVHQEDLRWMPVTWIFGSSLVRSFGTLGYKLAQKCTTMHWKIFILCLNDETKCFNTCRLMKGFLNSCDHSQKPWFFHVVVHSGMLLTWTATCCYSSSCQSSCGY